MGAVRPNLLGNVKLGNVDFILTTLTSLLSPDLYRPVVDAIEDHALMINRAKIAVSFTAREIVYDRKTNRVFVVWSAIQFRSREH